MAAFRRILHASDFSRASMPAFKRAVGLARANRAPLVIAHVLMPPLVPVDGAVSPKVFEEVEVANRAGGQKQLQQLVARARKAGVNARGLLLEGVAHEKIAAAARSTRADLLVLGTHGRTGLARVFLGSVAARVVALAPCPVLTVRAR
jgi:nucleotide-binding universal stress UspA family protein